MIKVADNLWVGNSLDAEKAEVDCILNVAVDLKGVRGWPAIMYAQVGLIDGPGNPMESYCAAVIALHTLVRTGKRVLVHCHEGKSRSMSVAIMYMHLVTERDWDSILASIRERVDHTVPDPHQAHKDAFTKIDWFAVEGCIEGI